VVPTGLAGLDGAAGFAGDELFEVEPFVTGAGGVAVPGDREIGRECVVGVTGDPATVLKVLGTDCGRIAAAAAWL
jgi:hypothetical protein